MKTGKFFLAFVALISILVTGCAKSTPEPVTYTIEMSEYSFSPNTLELKVGQQVTINLVNKGTLAHEIMFGREAMMMNNRPSGYQHDMFEESSSEPMVMGEMHMEGEHDAGHTGFMVVLPEEGDTASITFTVTDEMVGEWEMGCFEQEGVHYDAGMKGKITISK